MRIFFSDRFPVPLPENHAFPIGAYVQLRRRIAAQMGGPHIDMRVAEPATQRSILRAHHESYVRRFFSGDLTTKEIRRVGLPWSRQIVTRTRYSVGATIAACRTALTDGVAVNLGGGTHHAFHDHGRGFCWLNDCIIAARTLQDEGLAGKILIIDCDVHQGDGTAAIARNDATIFTFSIHGKNNFPFRKEPGDLDIEMDDGTRDSTYLEALQEGLIAATRRFSADMVIYLAGADPYRKDRFGRLALTKAGLAERDRRVMDYIYAADLPVAVTMAGGYAPDVADIVDIRFRTIEAILEHERRLNR